jgi:hypothetical protein
MSTIYRDKPGGLETWLMQNSGWLALGIIAAGFALRVVYSNLCYLNPDEAQHFSAARPSSWVEAYQASLGKSHPPLYILILHGFLFLGRSELIARLPSVVGGTAALWPAFAWMRRILGQIPALAGLVFIALSPAAISASSEVRQYGLLLCFVCFSIYATERALSEHSISWAIAQGLFLLGALLTNYTALIVILSITVYVVLYWRSTGVPRRIVITMGLCHLALAAVLVWLYFAHLRGRFSAGPIGAMDYLRAYYYASGLETPLDFAWRMVFSTFFRAVGSHLLALPSIIIFLAGVAAILVGRTKTVPLTAVLVASPFVIGFAAAVFQIFPFAGSRHQTYLLPFFAAGIAASFAWLQQRIAGIMLVAGTMVVAPIWAIRDGTPDNNRTVRPMSDMYTAMEYIRGVVPPGATLFVDYETREVLEYYLARGDKQLDRFRHKGVEEWLGGYRVVVPAKYLWAFRPDGVQEQIHESGEALGARSGDPVWVVSDAWVEAPLASRISTDGVSVLKQFGRISVIRTASSDQTHTPLRWPEARRSIAPSTTRGTE